ncbi:MAG: hypothetical protein OEY10_00365 [Nitrosopumilus sp.]|nr:hypothetical protein [Nitrosopumilus sp.]
MINTSINFHNRVLRGESPEAYIEIKTHMGTRAYAEESVSEDAISVGRLADGTWLADGTVLAGGDVYMLSRDKRVKQYGRLTDTIAAKQQDLLSAFSSKRQGSFTVTLDNTDLKLSALMASEPFISRPLYLKLGFEDIDASEHIILFRGIITDIQLTQTLVSLTAIEA